MSSGNCDLCLRWSSDLIEGVCGECRERHNLNELSSTDTEWMEDLKTPPYTQHLAERVTDALEELCCLPSQRVIQDIISEALFNAAQEIRQGKCAELEYIGTLRSDNSNMMFTPDKWLLSKNQDEQAARELRKQAQQRQESE
ncbi:hypothetical protein [Candidatus Vondammii sp. HM_W22]|uniref:hypothetical protein n=1 Tax=Candidatus Vondammii sp. HM_W22 TaxID=2687299 RepID=UPI001F13614D|nr:hypothetical protein [Candidatus Vondammii sp. HM_W22]